MGKESKLDELIERAGVADRIKPVRASSTTWD